MKDYSKITDADFDRILGDILAEEGRKLLSVPGVYEAVSEHFNNEVLSRYENEEAIERVPVLKWSIGFNSSADGRSIFDAHVEADTFRDALKAGLQALVDEGRSIASAEIGVAFGPEEDDRFAFRVTDVVVEDNVVKSADYRLILS